jgi:hypothetical protein
MTLQQMAQYALDVQTACNLSGIVRTFAEITHSMRSEHGLNTPECNTHPVTVLFTTQLMHLAGLGVPDGGVYDAASRACEVLSSRCPGGSVYEVTR